MVTTRSVDHSEVAANDYLTIRLHGNAVNFSVCSPTDIKQSIDRAIRIDSSNSSEAVFR